MSWNIEIQRASTASVEATLSHLAEHYPHLQSITETVEEWIASALQEDARELGLSLPVLSTRDEQLTYFWETRQLVRDSIEHLNASLEDDWNALEAYRPLFPEYDDIGLLAA